MTRVNEAEGRGIAGSVVRAKAVAIRTRNMVFISHPSQADKADRISPSLTFWVLSSSIFGETSGNSWIPFPKSNK